MNRFMLISLKSFYRLLGFCSLLIVTLFVSACQTIGFTEKKDTKALIEQAMERAIRNDMNVSSNGEQLSYYKKLYSLNPSDANISMRYATALRKAGMVQESIYILLPFEMKPVSKTKKFLNEMAASRLALGEIEKASILLKNILKKDKYNTRANHLMGIVQDSYGNHEKAILYYQEALKRLDVNPAPLLNNIALNQAHRGDMEQAIATLYQAATISPDRMEIRENLAILQSIEGQNRKMNTSLPHPVKRPRMLLADGSSIVIPLPPKKPKTY